MKICDLTTLYIDGGVGGVNTYLREKAAYLSRSPERFRHVLVVPAGRSEIHRANGTTTYSVASPRYFRNPQHRVIFNYRAVAEILRREQPDVIEVDCVSPLARVAAKAFPNGRRPPIVGYYHVHLPAFYSRPNPLALLSGAALLARQFIWRYIRRCTRPCDRIVVPSLEIFSQLEERGFRRLEHIPLGVNLELFQPAANGAAPHHGPPSNGSSRRGPMNGSASAAANGSVDSRCTVLFVGRLSKEKDIALLLSAFDRLPAKNGYRLRIAGDGPLRARVEDYARARENVEYIGLCPYGQDLAGLYREADVLAVPSPCETFGLVILEALASGIPVAAVRQGGPIHLLKPELGALCRPGDAADFAEKIAQLARARKPPQEYREHVVRHYSWKRTFDRLLLLYQELLLSAGARREEACRAGIN